MEAKQLARQEYHKTYYAMNKEHIKQYQKEYYKSNKDDFKTYSQTYYNENKQKLKDYYEANKQHLIEYQKQYHKDNKVYSFTRHKRKSIEKALADNQRRVDEYKSQLRC